MGGWTPRSCTIKEKPKPFSFILNIPHLLTKFGNDYTIENIPWAAYSVFSYKSGFFHESYSWILSFMHARKYNTTQSFN